MKRHHQPMVKVEIKPVANLGYRLSLEWQSNASSPSRPSPPRDYAIIAPTTASHPTIREGREGIPMATIDDFVNHRWTDAKEALRQQDPDYVSKVEDLEREFETRNGLLVLSPEAIPPFEVNETPRRPLTTEWHKLLESCNEMTMQADIIRIVAASLTGNQVRQAENNVAGRLFLYHFRSFPIHVEALFQRAHDVIRKTAEVYRADRKSIGKLIMRYKQAMNQQKPDILDEIRNSYVHATKQSWAKKVTEEQNWEPAVVIGQTLRIALEAQLYPRQGSRFKSGDYTHFVDAADIFLNDIGKVLGDFEQDLIANHKLKYRMDGGE